MRHRSLRGARAILPHGARALAAVLLCGALAACSGAPGGGPGGGESTSGASFDPPAQVVTSPFSPDGATSSHGASIDTSHVAQGYVAAAATDSNRLKLEVSSGDTKYYYDLPGDGTPIAAPLTLGSGSYLFRVMRNTTQNQYVEICAARADVLLESDFAPYLRPSVYCDYGPDSACVAKAQELAQGASNQGEAVRAICEYVVQNVSYDYDKARQLANATGYVPNPDETLASGKGICFDYASLGAAMLRSQGIPTQIVTGNVAPDDIYHAWIMVNIDGTWKSAQFSVDQNTWSRVDLTFAATAGDDQSLVGDGNTYTERYVY